MPDDVDEAVAALTSAAGKIYAMWLKPEWRDRLTQEIGHISSASLATSLVVSGLTSNGKEAA